MSGREILCVAGEKGTRWAPTVYGTRKGEELMREAMTPVERVTAVLERREPDRVPVLDVMEEFANVYQIDRSRSRSASSSRTSTRRKIIDLIAPAIRRSGIMEKVLDDFAYDRTEAAVEFGYDDAWTHARPHMAVPGLKSATDIYGRTYDLGFDKYGNWTRPCSRGGLIKSPDDWYAWDKRALMKYPARTNKVFKKIMKDFGDSIFVMPGFLFGLFENTWQPMGFERFTVALRRERDFLKRVIKFNEDDFWHDARGLGRRRGEGSDLH